MLLILQIQKTCEVVLLTRKSLMKTTYQPQTYANKVNHEFIRLGLCHQILLSFLQAFLKMEPIWRAYSNNAEQFMLNMLYADYDYTVP